MSAPLAVEEVLGVLQKRFGKWVQVGRSSRLLKFGNALTCSVNYSRILRGHKFFFGLSQEVASGDFPYPATDFGDFVLLICGSAGKVLVLPREVILEMLQGVATRKLDVFFEDGAYI